jgi:hypothetical protein
VERVSVLGPDRAAKGEKALYVKMIPESLVDPDINPELVLTPEALQQAGFERRREYGVRWTANR